MKIHYQEHGGKKQQKYITKNTEKKDKSPKIQGQKNNGKIHCQEKGGKKTTEKYIYKNTRAKTNRKIHYQEHEGKGQQKDTLPKTQKKQQQQRDTLPRTRGLERG